MKVIIKLCVDYLLLFLLLFSTFTYAGPVAPFDRLVFFGDSLTDNGNLYHYLLGFLPKSPPYYQGRFSDGPVWSEWLSDLYAGTDGFPSSNYAVGGQTVLLHDPLQDYFPYTLSLAIDNYLLHSAFANRTSTLFIFWIAANDYLPVKKSNTQNNPRPNDDADELTSNVVDKMYDLLKNLIAEHGAQNLLIINLPDLSLTPYARSSDKVAFLHRLSMLHNQKLSNRLTLLQQTFPAANIKLFDIDKVFKDLIDNSNDLNVKDPCWDGGYTFAPRDISSNNIRQDLEAFIQQSVNYKTYLLRQRSAMLANYIQSSPSLMEAYQVAKLQERNPMNMCIDPEHYLFWDHLHPSASIHKYLAEVLWSYIENNFKHAKRH